MKNVKISLLAAGATLALLACSSLEVDNPTEENFPKDWSAAEYIKVNPDLRALQIRDQVNYMNTVSGAENDDDAFFANLDVVKALMIKHGGMTEEGFDTTHSKYIKAFNIRGVENESAIFDTLTLDTAVFEKQYVVYGAIEGRPYRSCKDNDANLVKKCESTQADEAANVGFSGHLYCAKEGVTYCLDCEPQGECPDDFVVPEESSSSAAKPASSETAGDESSSSEGGETADSSSSEGGENPESSEASADSSSSEEAAAESSSSAE